MLKKIMIAQKDEFKIFWVCTKQQYQVYKNSKLLTVAYRFKDVKSYTQ
jgi:hypothetical protein